MLHKMLIHFKIYWTRILYQDAPDTPDVSCTHLNKGRVHNLSVNCHLDLFDKIIIPMLTYGSEIWGYENIDILEKVHVKFCKLLLNLKTSTPNFMLYGELGRYPLNITVLIRHFTNTTITPFTINVVATRKTRLM